MNFDLSTIDWTAISSIVSLIMVIATFVTLRVNSKQLKEIKRQWKEEHRPNLQISLVVKNEHFLVCVSNVGNDLAINVKLKFNDFFKETLFARQLREAFVETENIPFVIQAHDSKYFYLMPTMGFGTVSYPSTHEAISGADFEKWVEEHGEDMIEVGCCYSSQSGTDKYTSQYSTLLKHCFGHTAAVIDNEVDAILEVSKRLQHIEKLIKNQK